jgi:hypothetical protein
MEKVVATALLMKGGLVLSLPRPARHWHVQTAAVELGISLVGNHEQGFLTSEGRFVRRAPARVMAFKAGQLAGKPISKVFTSEELW